MALIGKGEGHLWSWPFPKLPAPALRGSPVSMLSNDGLDATMELDEATTSKILGESQLPHWANGLAGLALGGLCWNADTLSGLRSLLLLVMLFSGTAVANPVFEVLAERRMHENDGRRLQRASCFEVGARVRIIPGSRYSTNRSAACGTVSIATCMGGGYKAITFDDGYSNSYEYTDFEICPSPS